MSKPLYEDTFFNYVNTTSGRSAYHFLEKVEFPFSIESVLDVGCGQGAWLNCWKRKYPNLTIFGVDGDYVNQENLLINKEFFQSHDLTKPLDLNRNFSLVECLEVGEHLDAAFSDNLVDSLIRHGQVILFSAAQKGQGGEFHVNEQPIDYWVKKFSERNFACIDCVRPQIQDDANIEPWYRFNAVLFVHRDLLPKLPPQFAQKQVGENYDFTVLINQSWLLRNKIIGLLPLSMVTQLSRIKQKLLPMIRR